MLMIYVIIHENKNITIHWVLDLCRKSAHACGVRLMEEDLVELRTLHLLMAQAVGPPTYAITQ